MIPFWVYETAVATGLVVASFRAFCDQRRIVEAKEEELKKVTVKHAEEKRVLEEKIQSLIQEKNSAAEEAERKRKMKDVFTTCFVELGIRRREIWCDGGDAYEMQLRDEVDQESWEIIKKAQDCVKTHLGKAEADLFISDAGFPAVGDNEPHQRWKGVINALEQREIRLSELIRKHT